jgi:hypothetical protein
VLYFLLTTEKKLARKDSFLVKKNKLYTICQTM